MIVVAAAYDRRPNVVGHDDVGADIRTVLFTVAGKILKGSMKRRVRQKGTPIERASRYEINWGANKDPVQPSKPLFMPLVVLGVGGHRPPLQWLLQSLQQLPVDPVEPAVTENRD